MQEVWQAFCMTLIHKNMTQPMSSATFQLYLEVSIIVQLQNSVATARWWDQKWWNLKFHIFWSRDQTGAWLWPLFQKINFVSCFWRSQVDLDNLLVTQLPLCVENRLDKDQKKRTHFFSVFTISVLDTQKEPPNFLLGALRTCFKLQKEHRLTPHLPWCKCANLVGA